MTEEAEFHLMAWQCLSERGSCAGRSRGSTFSIANEIFPTLKQFPSVLWVKIYDPSGHTQRPYGHSDSIPESLEP